MSVTVGRKNCHAKGREVTSRIYSQLWRVDCRSLKISAVCLMVLRQIFCWFTGGSAAQTHCARLPQLVNKKFFEEEIFAGTNFRELACDRENVCLVKISCYTVVHPSWIVGASLSEPYTSETALRVHMYVGLLVCGHRKLRMNMKYTYISNLHTCFKIQ